MFTFLTNSNILVLESYVPLVLSIIWPSLSRIAAPFWKMATESLVLKSRKRVRKVLPCLSCSCTVLPRNSALSSSM